MSEVRRRVVWAHGFGSHPSVDPPSRAARPIARKLGDSVSLVVPELSDRRDGVLTPLPISEQAQRLGLALNGDGPVELVTHSQAVWAAGRFLEAHPGRRFGHVVLLAPPLSGPTQRLQRPPFREPHHTERGFAPQYDGVHCVKDWEIQTPGGPQPQLTVVPRRYWSEVSDRAFDPHGLVSAVLRHADSYRIITAGEDQQLGDQAAEFEALAATVPGLRVETVPGADHLFSNCGAAIAKAALTGVSVHEAMRPTVTPA